ncbi:MAG: hypothetical protein Q9167_000290 [Letrouitia subvulpina]
MCISLFSTAHPDYDLILLSNRDEYLSRPTAPADWWSPPNGHVLGGRDLLRPVQGTWLGITRQGRIAVLTNFREEGQVGQEARSRGALVNDFLTQDPKISITTEDYVSKLVEGEGVEGVGGFSLVCGKVGEPLAVVSNRAPNVKGIPWIVESKGETVGLSNAAFGDDSWPKVNLGVALANEVLERAAQTNASKEELIEMGMKLLSTESLPKRKVGEGWESYVRELRNSILIPPIGGEGMDGEKADSIAAATSTQRIHVDEKNTSEYQNGLSGYYGTQKQTVLLVTRTGRVTFVERTLYDERARRAPDAQRDRRFDFDIES